MNRACIADLQKNINFYLENIADEKMGFKFESISNDEISILLELIIKEIMINRAYLYLEKNHSLKESIHKLSNCCKKAGNHLFSCRKYSNAISFYEKSVDLHTQFLQPQFIEELFNLYSNLIICYVKKYDHEAVIRYANLAEKISGHIDLTQGKNKLIFEKINYHKANSLLEKYKKYLKEKDYKEEMGDYHVKQIYIAISCVTSVEMVSKLTKETELIQQGCSDGRKAVFF